MALARRLLAAAPGPRDEALAVLNGMIGDRLESAGSSLALPLTLVTGPDFVAVDKVDPRPAGSSMCLFVHGLMGSPRAWIVERDGERADYGAALARERGVVPVFASYNSGRHISTNGRALAESIEELHGSWPDLEQISIISHSMGGLVTRSACHYGLEAGHAWVDRVDRVMLLGVPSHGAPLEQLAHLTAFTLDAIWNPWTKLLGKALNLRSAGIKDLRHGFVLDDDWRHRDPDQLRFAVPRPARPAPRARWYVAAASLGPDGGMLGKILGDGLVRTPSAAGRGFGSPEGVLPAAEVRVFEGTTHNGLMGDPAVLDQLLRWWDDG